MNAQTPQKFTLEEIAERKKKLLNEIHAQKKAMTATTREIFAPLAPATNKADAIMFQPLYLYESNGSSGKRLYIRSGIDCPRRGCPRKPAYRLYV